MYEDNYNFDAKSLYMIAKVNKYHLPPQKSKFVDIAYITKVLKEEYFCPSKLDVRTHTCNKPPAVKDILVEVRLLEAAMEWQLGIKEEGPYPPAEWLLDILQTYSPNHRYFDKAFFPA